MLPEILLIFLIFFLFYCSDTIPVFRILFPSWRFFEKPYTDPIVHISSGNSEDSLSTTEILTEPPRYRLWSLFFNPKFNFYLAQRSFIERCINDLSSNGETYFEIDNASFKSLCKLSLKSIPLEKTHFSIKITLADGSLIFKSNVLKAENYR